MTIHNDNMSRMQNTAKLLSQTVASAVCRSRNNATGLEIVIKIRSDLAIALLT